MNAKHTPGPWVVWDSVMTPPVGMIEKHVGTPSVTACVVYADRCKRDQVLEAEANALLISAAPEMLSVLRECLTLLEDPDAGEVEAGIVEARIREVLARAEGGGL